MFTADTLSQSDMAAIARVRDQWLASLNADDLDGLMAASATGDMIALPPHEPALLGPEANRQWHRARIEQFTSRITLASEEIQGGAVWAFERMSFSIVLTPRAGGAAIEDRGSCLWMWQRQTDGQWRVARAIWNSSVPLPASDSEADVRAIRQVADTYTDACNAGDADALVATCSPDIVFLPPDDEIVIGSDAVRVWLETQFFGPFNVQLSFSFAELDVRGDRAITHGPFQMRLTPKGEGEAVVITGKYVDVFHRQGDGAWKFGRVIFNRNHAAA